MTPRHSPGTIFGFAAIYLIWGSTFLANKIAIQSFPPFLTAGIRSFLAGAVLYGWGRARGTAPPTLRQWGACSAVGAMLFLGGQGAAVWSLQRVPSGLACVCFATVPLWATLISVISEEGKTHLGQRVAGVGVGLLGIVILVGPGLSFAGPSVDLLGVGVLIASSVSWAVGSSLAQRLPRHECPPVGNGSYLLAGGGLLFLVSLGSGEIHRVDVTRVSEPSLMAVGYLILFGSVVAFSSYSWLLRRTSLTAVSTYAFANPIVAIILGWVFAGEPLNTRVFLVTGLIVSAILLCSRPVEVTQIPGRGGRPLPESIQAGLGRAVRGDRQDSSVPYKDAAS